MAIFRLTPRLIKLIGERLGSLFDNTKQRLLGTNKTLTITHDPVLTIPAIYAAASKEQRRHS